MLGDEDFMGESCPDDYLLMLQRPPQRACLVDYDLDAVKQGYPLVYVGQGRRHRGLMRSEWYLGKRARKTVEAASSRLGPEQLSKLQLLGGSYLVCSCALASPCNAD